MLLRGTPLHAAKEQLQLVESSDLNLQINRIQENIPHVVSSPSFTYEDWCAMAETAEALDTYNNEMRNASNYRASKKMQATLRGTLFWNSKKENEFSTTTDAEPVFKP
jgi:hypothetical protein